MYHLSQPGEELVCAVELIVLVEARVGRVLTSEGVVGDLRTRGSMQAIFRPISASILFIQV